jgi:hypothetical protein
MGVLLHVCVQLNGVFLKKYLKKRENRWAAPDPPGLPEKHAACHPEQAKLPWHEAEE